MLLQIIATADAATLWLLANLINAGKSMIMLLLLRFDSMSVSVLLSSSFLDLL
jgi:hypothetical protein